MSTAPPGEAVERVAARVRELAAAYDPPDFAHVPTADAALFLCAIDHKTGYREGHRVGGRGPFEGSELLWELACAAERERPGTLSAAALDEADGDLVAELFRAGAETVRDPAERARLWRDLAAGLIRDYGGGTGGLIATADRRLGGEGGLVSRLPATRPTPTRSPRRRSCSPRSPSAAAGSRSPIRRAGRSARTTC